MRNFLNKCLPSFFVVSTLLSVTLVDKIHAQNSNIESQIDVIETFQPLHAVQFTYGRFGENDRSLVMLSIPFQPYLDGAGELGFFKISNENNDETWLSEKLEIGNVPSLFFHYIFDFDRDGFDDIIIAGGNSYNDIILLRHIGESGSLEFEPPVYLQTEMEDEVRGLLVRDINNDGYEDLVAQNYTWIGINNRGKSLLSFYPPVEHDYSHRPQRIFDTNKDGWPDIYFNNTGPNGTFFLTKDGVFDLSDPKILPDYPRNIIPIDYTPDHNNEVVALDVELDRSAETATFELRFYRAHENFQLTQDHVFNYGPISFTTNNVDARIHNTAIPDSNGADIVFSYTVSAERRIHHFLKINQGKVEISSTDTTDHIGIIPNEIIDGKYISPHTNALKWLDNKPLVAAVERYSGIDLEATPAPPQNISTDLTDDLLTISWDKALSDSGKTLSYSVYLTNQENAFQYRSEYLVPFPTSFDQSQNRVFNDFKLFKNLPSGTYDIRVQSVDKFSRRSTKSSPISVTIVNNEAPEVPGSVKAHAANSGIEVSFQMTTYFDSVHVYRSTSNSPDDLTYLGKASMYQQKFLDENVSPSTIYNYALKAFLNDKESELTDTVSATTSSLNISNVFTLESSVNSIIDVISYDLNIDGFKDLIINTRDTGDEEYTLYLLPGSEQGYDQQNLKTLLKDELILNLKIGDWNGDLQPDLIYQSLNANNWSYPTNIHLLEELEVTETISFNAGSGFNTLTPPELFHVADLDLNGFVDLVYGGYENLIVAWNQPSGVETSSVTTDGFNTYGVQLLDLNQDGFEDLIVDEGPGSAPVVFMNQMNQEFQRKTVGLPVFAGTSEAGSYYEYLPILFNDDIYPDLLVGTAEVTHVDTLGDVYTHPVNKIYLYNPENEHYEESDFRLDSISVWDLHRPIHFNNDEYVDFISFVDNQVNILVNHENNSLSQQSFTLSSVSGLKKIIQSDTDHDGDQDILFLGYNSPTIYRIANDDEPVLSIPNTPQITDISTDEGMVTIEWNESHWGSNLDAHTGYGIRISSEDRNILVGNINPVTGMKSMNAKYSAFQNTSLQLPDLSSGTYTVSVSSYNPLDKSSGFSEVQEFTVVGTDIEWNDTKELIFELAQNYPNPFNPTTSISYQIPRASKVTLQVFDVTGRLVQTLVNRNQLAGSYQVDFDGTDIASGIYIYRLKAGQNVTSKVLTLIK